MDLLAALKSRQHKGARRNEPHPRADKKGHCPPGPPQGGEQAQQQEDPQHTNSFCSIPQGGKKEKGEPDEKG